MVQAQLDSSSAARLESLLRWFHEYAGEAYLTGAAARDLVSSGRIPHSRRAEILVPKLDKNALGALRERFPDLQAQQDDLRLNLSLPNTEGGSLNIKVASYRVPPAESKLATDLELTGIVGDLSTREITLHAFAINAEGEVLDPFGGCQDLKNKQIRPLENPRDIFRDRPEQILRIARYIAYYGYDVHPTTTRFVSRDAANILSVSRSSWSNEINSVLLGTHVDASLAWLLETGVLRFLLPEVVSLVDFHKSCEVHHKDCWDHTVQVTRKANPDLCTRWAALCHDIGKIWTRSVDRRGGVHFYRHEEFSAILFEGVAARFHMDPDLSFRIQAVIRLHGRVNLYESDWTDSAVRRLIRDSGDHLEDLIRFSEADFTSKRPDRIAEIRRQLNELEERIVTVRSQTAEKPPLPKGLGNVLMKEFDLPPRPILGDLRRGLERLCASEEIEAFQDQDYYIEKVRSIGLERVIELGEKKHEAK